MINDRSMRIRGNRARPMPAFRNTRVATALAMVIVCGAGNGPAVAAEPTTSLGRLAQLAPAPSAPALSGNLLPADRMAAWNPGLMSVGGIPSRTTIYKTLSPSGGDDSGAIQAALNSAPAGQVVMLNPGTFVVNNLLLIHRPITLRGSGAGMTKLVKTNGARPGRRRSSRVPMASWCLLIPARTSMTHSRSSLSAPRDGITAPTARRPRA